MPSQEYIAKQLEALTREDWQFIHQAVEERFAKAAPRRGEPPASKSFTEQKNRVSIALLNKAYSS